MYSNNDAREDVIANCQWVVNTRHRRTYWEANHTWEDEQYREQSMKKFLKGKVNSHSTTRNVLYAAFAKKNLER